LRRKGSRSLKVTDKFVIYSKQGSIATIQLNRPESINAITQSMRDLIFDALMAYSHDEEAKVCIIYGAGERGFCSGADLIEFGKTRSQTESRAIRKRRDLWGLLSQIEKPLIAAVHGYVIGAGLEITSLCDIRVASEDAVFGMPEVAHGFIPGAGGTQSFPRAIGKTHAMKQFLSDRSDRMTAQRAFELGLIHKMVSIDVLLKTAFNLAEEIVVPDLEVLTAMKTAVLDGWYMPMTLGLNLEKRLIGNIKSNK